MLYRDPQSNRISLFRRAAIRFATSLGSARRRRLAELDLYGMNGHMKRDLGLFDLDLSDLVGPK